MTPDDLKAATDAAYKQVNLPGSMSLREAARVAFMGGFELRVAYSPSRGLVLERVTLGRDLLPPHLAELEPAEDWGYEDCAVCDRARRGASA